MNQNTVSGDIVDLKLSQLGATQITKLRSHMYIVDLLWKRHGDLLRL